QAEDGIRDRNVTGVQTCALPISCRPCRAKQWWTNGHQKGDTNDNRGVPSSESIDKYLRWRTLCLSFFNKVNNFGNCRIFGLFRYLHFQIPILVDRSGENILAWCFVHRYG